MRLDKEAGYTEANLSLSLSGSCVAKMEETIYAGKHREPQQYPDSHVGVHSVHPQPTR